MGNNSVRRLEGRSKPFIPLAIPLATLPLQSGAPGTLSINVCRGCLRGLAIIRSVLDAIGRQDRLLKHLAIHNRRVCSRHLSFQLAEESGAAISPSTVLRRLKEFGVQARRPRKKPLLTDNHRPLRIGWAATYRDWTPHDWKSVLFSDE